MSVSWEEFVTKHAQDVLDSALRVVTFPADAEDVAQEVFLEIFRSKRLSEFADQPALIRTMANRRALDRLRKRKPTSELDGRELDSQGHDPSEYAIAAELDKRLREGLAALPVREAEVFCLITFEGCSVSEIAELLNISQGAVAKSLCKARGRLSATLGIARTEVRQ